MHRIIPELIIENCRARRYGGSFKAASMFLDVSGFSVMTDALMGQGREGAELLAVMMGAVFDPLVNAIFGQHGMIVGYAGDSISALFPVDVDESAAALRAVACAHAIQRSLIANPLFDTPYGKFRISAKIGLAEGSVSWGILRSRDEKRAIYYFRGDAVVGAAQAEQHAFGGDIILTDALRRSLAIDIETNPVSDFHALIQVSADLPSAHTVALPEVDPGVASIFAPREVISGDLRGEFRQTVHLFLRIPELADEALQHFMYTLFEMQGRYGGFLDRIDFGDKGCSMTMLWGAPVAHENDIDRALSLVLDLQEHASCPITAGITYYISHAGYVGGRLYDTYTAYGWGMNLAARFMTSAAQNEVWLDERVYQRVKQRFRCDPVGEQAFKGFAQKQKVYVLRGRKSRPETFFRGAMVGREAELQQLTKFIAPLWEGKHAGVLGIWGEAGMGKSRLVHEFRQTPVPAGRACLWAECQSDEILRRSFHPFRSWLLQYFDMHALQDYAQRAQTFQARMDELRAATGRAPLAAELQRAQPFLAALVELEWPDPIYEQLDARGRYASTMNALMAVLRAESLRQPLILFLEDAQYLDEESKAFLVRLKRALDVEPIPHPIAVIMAARWDGAKMLLEEGTIDGEIRLAPLPDQAIAEIFRDVLGKSAAPTLVHLVQERAEGNPLFVDQILRYLQEQHLLVLDQSGTWSMKALDQSSPLPTDISVMLVARLDRLARHVKEVIQAASVLGRVFDLPPLARMLAHLSTLQNAIAAAEDAAVWSPLSEIRYFFNHALLRDVAYNMQLQARRQELHALAFQALRDLFSGEIRRHYAELAHHCEQAALTSEAHRYLTLAGDAARDEYQNAEALAFYRRALKCVLAQDLAEQYRLRRECEKLLTELGPLDERAQEIAALQTLADNMAEPGAQAEVALLRARLAYARGQYSESAAYARDAMRAADNAGREDVALGAHWNLLDASYAQGMYKEALEQGEATMALARQQDARLAEASIVNTLGLVVLEMKNPSSARAYFEQSLNIFRAQGNLRGLSKVLTNLGNVAGYQGNFDTALEYYKQALQLVREIGSLNAQCLRLGNMGWVCGLLGDYQRAQTYLEQALRIAREIGDRRTEVFSLINLSAHEGAMRDFNSAIEHAEAGLTLAEQVHDRNAQAWALTYRGHALLAAGRPDEAQHAYQRALDMRRELDQAPLATEPEAGLARIALRKGEQDMARAHIEEILAQLEQDGTLEGTDQPLRVYRDAYLVLNELDDPRARGLLNSAHDMLKTRANGISDPRARQAFLEKVPHNVEILSLWEDRRRGTAPTSLRSPDRQ